MLSTLEIALNSFMLVLAAVAIYSLFTGSKAPPNSWLTKYYAAEKYLGPVGNVMLIALGATSAFKLALHFGVVAPSDPDSVSVIVGTPFFVLAVAYLVLWFRAWRKVKASAKAGAQS